VSGNAPATAKVISIVGLIESAIAHRELAPEITGGQVDMPFLDAFDQHVA